MNTKKINELVNADFAARVVLDTSMLPWIPSPQAGVDRRLLDRIGSEVARATSIVRYAPDSFFPGHLHAMGEEYLVLDGVFSDEHGHYPVGTYVRNPPGSRHTPFTKSGCTILVKLRQMLREDEDKIVIAPDQRAFKAGTSGGHEVATLFNHENGDEKVSIERFAAETKTPRQTIIEGEEIFVLSGAISDEHGDYGARTWIRNPDGFEREIFSKDGAVVWRKQGHLTPARLVPEHA